MNHNVERGLDFHEAANIFPLDEDHLDDLADDIRNQGQQVPIELLDGRILDGRRRYLACKRAEVEPKFREVEVSDPIAYVLSLNLHRRHLTPSQLSMVGARARDYYDEQAKDRQKRKPTNSVPVNLPEQIKGDARDHAARAVGVSGKSIGKKDFHLDHQEPFSRGGADSNRNLVIACNRCDQEKGAMTLEEYRAFLVNRHRGTVVVFHGEKAR